MLLSLLSTGECLGQFKRSFTLVDLSDVKLAAFLAVYRLKVKSGQEVILMSRPFRLLVN